MNTFKHSDLVEFIKSQPDDKFIRMDQYDLASECGCVMAQFAKETKLIPPEDYKDSFCSFSIIGKFHSDHELKTALLINKLIIMNVKTYKEAKEILKKHE